MVHELVDLDRLSAIQQHYLYLHLLHPTSPVCNGAGVFSIMGRIDPAILTAAFQDVLRDVPILRTGYSMTDIGIQSVFRDLNQFCIASANIPESAVSVAAFREICYAEANRPLELANGEVIRATLGQLDSNLLALLISAHHIAADARSVDIILARVAARYRERVGSSTEDSRALFDQVHDESLELICTPASELLVRSWATSLRGGNFGVRSSRGTADPIATVVTKSYRVASRVQKNIRNLAATLNVQIFTVLLAAVNFALAAMRGGENHVVGVPFENRTTPARRHLIAPLVNMLPVRLPQARATRSHLLHIERSLRIALRCQQIPQRELFAEAFPDAIDHEFPRISTWVNYRKTAYFRPISFGPAIAFERRRVPICASLFPLGVLFEDDGDGLSCAISSAICDSEPWSPDASFKAVNEALIMLSEVL